MDGDLGPAAAGDVEPLAIVRGGVALAVGLPAIAAEGDLGVAPVLDRFEDGLAEAGKVLGAPATVAPDCGAALELGGPLADVGQGVDHLVAAHAAGPVADDEVVGIDTPPVLDPDPDLPPDPEAGVGVVGVGDQLDDPANKVPAQGFGAVLAEGSPGVVVVALSDGGRTHAASLPLNHSGREASRRSRMVRASARAPSSASER